MSKFWEARDWCLASSLFSSLLFEIGSLNLVFANWLDWLPCELQESAHLCPLPVRLTSMYGSMWLSTGRFTRLHFTCMVICGFPQAFCFFILEVESLYIAQALNSLCSPGNPWICYPPASASWRAGVAGPVALGHRPYGYVLKTHREQSASHSFSK